MMRSRLTLSAPILVLVFLNVAAPAQTTPIAFRQITIVDLERGRLVRDQTVVVQNGRISRVGHSSTVKIDPASTIIDSRGKFLLPGFADMHVHLYTEGDLFTYLANGITTVRNMAGDPSHLDLKRRVASGELLGPRIITAGPIIETALSHPDNQLVRSVDEARNAVSMQRAAGYDFIKVYNALRPDLYQAVVGQGKISGMPVVGHVPYEVGLGTALSSRQRSIEHLRGYLHRLLPADKSLAQIPDFRSFTVAWNDASRPRMRQLARETAKAGVWNCPTFVFTVHEMSPDDAHNKIVSRPETTFLSLSGLPKDRTKGYLGKFTDSDFRAAQRGLLNQFRLVKELDRAGAGLLVGTDSWLSGYAFADELELLVKSGLSPARVLRMATIDAARFLNEENERGSIKVGKVADLVVLDADPLISIGNTRKVRGVMTAGQYHTREGLDRNLEQLRQKLRKDQ